MKKLLLVTLLLLIGLQVFSQRRRRGNMNRIPQTNTEPTEQAIEKQKRLIEERMEEYITNFLTTLEADDFLKEITRQTLKSYFEAKTEILETKYERSFQRKEAVDKLNKIHFQELKELMSESDIKKIEKLTKGEFDEKEVVKKRKEKRKNRIKN